MLCFLWKNILIQNLPEGVSSFVLFCFVFSRKSNVKKWATRSVKKKNLPQ